MVGVVFTEAGIVRFQQFWEYVLCNFKPDTIYCHGPGDSLPGTVLKNAVVIAGPEDLPSDHALVVLAPTTGMAVRGTNSLVNFSHPEKAIYWFGSDNRHLESDVFAQREPDHLIYVPTDTHDQMYSFTTWPVVAWDRRSKE